MKVSLNGTFILFLGLILYSFASFLILLRDPFILERLALDVSLPAVETQGLRLAQVLKVNYTSILLLLTATIISYLGYIKLWYQKRQVSWPIVLLLILPVLVSFPSLSTDIFDYNNFNRVAYIHQSNPWMYPANSFPDDGNIYLGSWIDRTSVYPPLTFIVNSSVFYLFGASAVGAIIGFKLIATLQFVAIGLIIHRAFPDKKYLATLWLANPLMLVEFVGNGHNDLTLSLFTVLAIVYWQRTKLKSTSMAITAAILSKVSMIIYLPFWLLHQAVHKNTPLILKVVGLSLTSLLFVWVLMGETGQLLLSNISEQTNIYQKSLPTVVRYGLLQIVDMPTANLLQKLLLAPVLIIVAVVGLLKGLKLIDYLVVGMMAYLLVYAPMLQPWYVAWFFCLVPFIENKKVRVTAILLTLGGMLTYVGYYLSLFLNPTHILWQLVLALLLVIWPLLVILIPRRWYTQKIDYLASAFT